MKQATLFPSVRDAERAKLRLIRNRLASNSNTLHRDLANLRAMTKQLDALHLSITALVSKINGINSDTEKKHEKSD